VLFGVQNKDGGSERKLKQAEMGLYFLAFFAAVLVSWGINPGFSLLKGTYFHTHYCWYFCPIVVQLA